MFRTSTVRSFVVALVLLTPGVISQAQLQQKPDGTRPANRLTVTGKGEIHVKPDRADIVIGVTNEDKSSQTAANANAALATKVQAEVKRLGIATTDIQTFNYSIYPLMTGGNFGGVDSARKPEITGYRVTNQVRVTVRNLSKISDILDAATQAGSNTIDSISFRVEDETTAENDALEMAVRDARRKADHIARAAGLNILSVLDVNEGGGFRPGPIQMSFSGAGRASTPIEAGQTTVSANVTIVYSVGPMKMAKAPVNTRLSARK